MIDLERRLPYESADAHTSGGGRGPAAGEAEGEEAALAVPPVFSVNLRDTFTRRTSA
jgi:hypothetical protein